MFTGMRVSEDKASENIPFLVEFFWSLGLSYVKEGMTRRTEICVLCKTVLSVFCIKFNFRTLTFLCSNNLSNLLPKGL